MISKETVLVLGAGASADYRFPVGRTLLSDVCKLEENPEILYDLGFKTGEVEPFFSDLKHTAHSSVDAFLERFVDSVEIGKAAIAAALIPSEVHDNLFPPHAPKRHWYEFLVNKLGICTDEYEENRLSIITFNYDRSLEHYLYTVMRTRCRRSDVWAYEALQKIPIIHVHGSLGLYAPADGTGQPYEPKVTPDRVRDAADEIRIVSDPDTEMQQFRDARTLLEKAERIYFLGFGYHPENVRRLEVFNEAWSNERKNAVQVLGTSQGISSKDWPKVRSEIMHNNIDSRRSDTFILPFFLEVAELD